MKQPGSCFLSELAFLFMSPGTVRSADDWRPCQGGVELTRVLCPVPFARPDLIQVMRCVTSLALMNLLVSR